MFKFRLLSSSLLPIRFNLFLFLSSSSYFLRLLFFFFYLFLFLSPSSYFLRLLFFSFYLFLFLSSSYFLPFFLLLLLCSNVPISKVTNSTNHVNRCDSATAAASSSPMLCWTRAPRKQMPSTPKKVPASSVGRVTALAVQQKTRLAASLVHPRARLTR